MKQLEAYSTERLRYFVSVCEWQASIAQCAVIRYEKQQKQKAYLLEIEKRKN